MKRLPLFSLVLGLLIYSHAQSQSNNSFGSLSELDTKAAKTGFILNFGLPSTQINKMRNNSKQYDKGVAVNEGEWISIYEGLIQADARVNKLLSRSSLRVADRKTRPDNTVIPIGIINIDANVLTQSELKGNKDLKAKGKNVNGDKYETMHIFLTSVLQEDVYKAGVSFLIDFNKVFSNNDNTISAFYIDFNDGKGFVKIPYKNGQSYPYTFSSLGERIITFKCVTKRGTFISHSTLKIESLKQPNIYKELLIEVSQQIQAPSPNGRVAASFSSGKANITLGCDKVFDKPVIIVEGYDPTNSNYITNWLIPHYSNSGAFQQGLLNNGYDFVYLDFNDATDYIQNNANVLIDLILQVNRLKVGSIKSIVIGESMGGLVARYALRKMELNGQTHNVSHYISFDTPHKGANVPIGIQTLAQDASSTTLAQILPFIIPQDLRDIINSSNTPAAKQMLIRYYGENPHPLFNTFQNEINGMGYPTMCRNLALVNGSVSGAIQNTGFGTPESPGQLMLWLNGFYGAAQWNAIANTNLTNNTTQVSHFDIIIVIPTTNLNRYAYSPFNYDITPGGVDRNVNTQDPQRRFNFSFIPTFSAIDYKGPLTSQNDLYINAANANAANGLSPFWKVYGDNYNDLHIRVPEYEASSWLQLFQEQLGITPNNTACSSSNQAPPPPYFNGTYYLPCSGYTFRLVNESIGSLYNVSWTVQPGNLNFVGDTFTLYPNMIPNNIPYTVTATVSYNGSTATSSVSSTIYSICRSGGRIATEESTTMSESTVFPNPSGGRVLLRVALAEAEEASVEIVDAQGRLIKTQRLKGIGEQHDFEVDTQDLPNGMYLLQVHNPRIQFTHKLLISR